MSRLVVPVSGRDHTVGRDDAQVTLVEYGDFACHFCGRAYFIIQQLREDVGDSLRLVFRQFPLTQIHPNALPAAQAAEAAGLQGNFWEFYDLLFANQPALADKDLLQYAATLQLSLDKFNRDRRSELTAAHIQEDFMGGIRSGVNGTPTFFINGRRHEGSYAYDDLFGSVNRAMRYARL